MQSFLIFLVSLKCFCDILTPIIFFYFAAVLFFSELLSRFQNEDTMLFCLRVMVGLIILYDHVHPMGAFQKNCPIDVSILQRQGSH